MRRTGLFRGFCLLCLAFVAMTGRAPAAETTLQDKLERLSEVLGSVHYLRNLCGEKSNMWREKMDELLAAESADSERKARFIARFNRGYRSFAGSYEKCTPSASDALSRYMREGETLSNEIVLRYGN